MQDNLGAGNSSDKEFLVKGPFCELGKLLCLAKHCWKIADWSYTSWSQRFDNFCMACSGCQWRDCLVHGGILLFRVVYAACLDPWCVQQTTRKRFQNMSFRAVSDWLWYFRLRRRSTSVTKPWIPWRSRSFRLDEDQVRSSDLEQLKWLYRMTHTKIKFQAISLSLIHDTWNRINVLCLCRLYDFHFCSRIACAWPRNVLKSHMQAIFFFEVTRLVEREFEETLNIFEIFLRRMKHFASNSVINFVPNQTCECVYVDNGVAAWQCRTFFMRRCRLPATAGRAFSRCHGAAPIGIMISMMTRHGKYGKAWKAVGLHG